MINAVFNSFDFAANGLSIHNLDVYSSSPRRLQLEDRASGDGSVLVSSRYSAKPVTIEGLIKAETSTELEQRIDAVQLALSAVGGVLDIDHAGSTRRFIATAQPPVITRESYGATLAEYSVEFVVPDGYGSDTDLTQLIATTSFTTSTYDFPITVEGSYKAQPNITINLAAVTAADVPPQHITVRNPDNSSSVTIAAEFEAGDTITIDCARRRAYRNYAEVETSGNFPYWTPGAASLQYSDDLDTRSVSLSATYTRRYV